MFFLLFLVVLLLVVVLFLAKELWKKFGFIDDFARRSGQLKIFHYPGAKKSGIKPGMRKIVLRGREGVHFSVLIGFELIIPLLGRRMDYYGFVQAGEKGVAVFETYLGKGAATFMFIISREDPDEVRVTSGSAEQTLPANVSYPPHFYQRLGFYS